MKQTVCEELFMADFVMPVSYFDLIGGKMKSEAGKFNFQILLNCTCRFTYRVLSLPSAALVKLSFFAKVNSSLRLLKILHWVIHKSVQNNIQNLNREPVKAIRHMVSYILSTVDNSISMPITLHREINTES